MSFQMENSESLYIGTVIVFKKFGIMDAIWRQSEYTCLNTRCRLTSYAHMDLPEYGVYECPFCHGPTTVAVTERVYFPF